MSVTKNHDVEIAKNLKLLKENLDHPEITPEGREEMLGLIAMLESITPKSTKKSKSKN